MTKLSVIWVVSILGAFGCARGEDPPGVAREPLARQAPVVTAAAPTPAPAQPAIKPVEVVVKAPAGLAKKASKGVEPAVAGEGLVIKRLVVTNSIEHRELVTVDQLALSEEPLFAFIEVANPGETPEQIEVTFEKDGRSVGHVKLEVPAKNKRWRTWGKTRQVRQAGEWVAVVKTADGKELSRKSFVVAP